MWIETTATRQIKYEVNVMNLTLTEAINTNQNITFTYKGKERKVSPWIYGIKVEKNVLFGYQIAGGNYAGVRLFVIEDMNNVQITSGDFNVPLHKRTEDWKTIHAEYSKNS
jgi:hypothetical protein